MICCECHDNTAKNAERLRENEQKIEKKDKYDRKNNGSEQNAAWNNMVNIYCEISFWESENKKQSRDGSKTLSYFVGVTWFLA